MKEGGKEGRRKEGGKEEGKGKGKEEGKEEGPGGDPAKEGVKARHYLSDAHSPRWTRAVEGQKESVARPLSLSKGVSNKEVVENFSLISPGPSQHQLQTAAEASSASLSV